VTQIDVTSGGNQGQRTVHVTGAGFTSGTTASLRNGAVVRNASPVTVTDANHLTATFDLTGLAAGSYVLEVDDGTRTATAATAFQVTTDPPEPVIQTILIVPSQVRTGSPMSANLKLTNYGNNDVLLPIIQFDASDARTANGGKPPVTEDPGLLQAGFLPALGFNFVQLGVTFVPSPSANHLVHGFSITAIPSDAPIDWSTSQGPSRPPTIPEDAWAAVWANYVAAVGQTAGDLQKVLQADQAYFAQLGENITDTPTLLDFEL
jgi:hypothetical protein